MTDTPGAKSLTEALLTVTRQQRHYGARVIISTQEPTISPRLIDLCAVTVVHRFTSPQWFSVLRQHISDGGYYGDDDDDIGGRDQSASSYSSINRYGDSEDASLYREQGGTRSATTAAAATPLFRRILALRTGEALVFAPSAVVTPSAGRRGSNAGGAAAAGRGIAAAMDRPLKVRIRKRLTWDGGRSITCV
jgi:hypothetical protein